MFYGLFQYFVAAITDLLVISLESWNIKNIKHKQSLHVFRCAKRKSERSQVNINFKAYLKASITLYKNIKYIIRHLKEIKYYNIP